MTQEDIMMLKEMMSEVVQKEVRKVVNEEVKKVVNEEIIPRIEKLEESVKRLEERMDRLEERVDKLESRMTDLENLVHNEVIFKLNVIIEGEELLLTKYEFNQRLSAVECEIQKIAPIVEIVSRHSEILNRMKISKFKVFQGGK